MEQFIIEQVIGMYKKKDKYGSSDDFDWVMRAVIRRKAINFVSYLIKRNSNIIFENEYKSDDVNLQTELDQRKSIKKYKENEKSKKIIELILELQYKITNKPLAALFTDWDREFIDVILELYELGYNVDRNEILECMGYTEKEKGEFNTKIFSFRNRLKKHCDFDLETLKEDSL